MLNTMCRRVSACPPIPAACLLSHQLCTFAMVKYSLRMVLGTRNTNPQSLNESCSEPGLLQKHALLQAEKIPKHLSKASDMLLLSEAGSLQRRLFIQSALKWLKDATTFNTAGVSML